MFRKLIEWLYIMQPNNLVFYEQGFDNILSKAWIVYFAKHEFMTKYNRYVTMIDLNGLKYINDKYGHASGDHYIRSFIAALRIACPPARVTKHGGTIPAIVRWGGDEFIIISDDDISNNLSFLLDKYKFPFSFGCVNKPEGVRIETAVTQADKKMYEMKQEFYTTHQRGEDVFGIAKDAFDEDIRRF